MQSPSLNKNFHVINPNYLSWNTLFNELAKLSPTLQKVSYAEWLSQLNQQLIKNNTSALSPFLDLLDLSADFPLENLYFECCNTKQ